jgi:hypothetical protein
MFQEHNMEINREIIKRMIGGERFTDDNGYVFCITKDEDDGYWGVGRYMLGEGGNWMPFGKRLTEKVIEKMISYIHSMWNKE